MESKVVGKEDVNAQRLREAHEKLDTMAKAAFQEGWHGTIAVELRVRNGKVTAIRRSTTATDS